MGFTIKGIHGHTLEGGPKKLQEQQGQNIRRSGYFSFDDSLTVRDGIAAARNQFLGFDDVRVKVAGDLHVRGKVLGAYGGEVQIEVTAGGKGDGNVKLGNIHGYAVGEAPPASWQQQGVYVKAKVGNIKVTGSHVDHAELKALGAGNASAGLHFTHPKARVEDSNLYSCGVADLGKATIMGCVVDAQEVKGRADVGQSIVLAGSGGAKLHNVKGAAEHPAVVVAFGPVEITGEIGTHVTVFSTRSIKISGVAEWPDTANVQPGIWWTPLFEALQNMDIPSKAQVLKHAGSLALKSIQEDEMAELAKAMQEERGGSVVEVAWKALVGLDAVSTLKDPDHNRKITDMRYKVLDDLRAGLEKTMEYEVQRDGRCSEYTREHIEALRALPERLEWPQGYMLSGSLRSMADAAEKTRQRYETDYIENNLYKTVEALGALGTLAYEHGAGGKPSVAYDKNGKPQLVRATLAGEASPYDQAAQAWKAELERAPQEPHRGFAEVLSSALGLTQLFKHFNRAQQEEISPAMRRGERDRS